MQKSSPYARLILGRQIKKKETKQQFHKVFNLATAIKLQKLEIFRLHQKNKMETNNYILF